MITYSLEYDWTPDEATEILMAEAYGKITEERETGVAGYYHLPEDSKLLNTEIRAYAASNPLIMDCDTIAVIGIGGSSLGTKAVDAMLRHKTPGLKRLVFLENPDPVDISQKFATIEKEKTLFIVVSKSGSTIETMSIFKAAISHFALDLDEKEKSRVIVVTDEGSVLCHFADYHGVKAYTIPDNVGGRFSVLSAVGLVPLTLAGYDTCSILQGAADMVARFFGRREKHIEKKAAFLATHWETYRMNVLFSYSTCLENFTKWYVQLLGESLGKRNRSGEPIGLTPIGQIGSIDQHSFLQLIMEGPRDKSVTFLKISDFENDLQIPDISLKHIEKTDYINAHTFNELINAECDATHQSIVEEGIPVDSITLDKIGERNIGELIVYYELLTSLMGAMLDINTYDQPGVERGKNILMKTFEKDK
ncbi:glucose-6-phosphate isomerase [Hydrogenimonas sp.]|uniref:glucose-6-phosphate isomerase n=1 Tax=Hydrogenimonas sp. TaxID=2231112 RepID=UPI00262A0059|nr:glucose-6-phosphate isomerase [Hydrogenimonas sp.]